MPLAEISADQELLFHLIGHCMAPIARAEISGNTLNVIVAATFITGACGSLAIHSRIPSREAESLAVAALQRFLNLDSTHAVGMLASNGRLARKYRLLHSIQQRGAEAMEEWLVKGSGGVPADVLHNFIGRCSLMSMSDLGIDGLMQQIGKEPSDDRASLSQPETPRPRRMGPHPALVATAGMILVIAGVALLWWLYNH